MEPTLIKAGLAFYKAGQGAPLLLMPYPHGYTLRPIAESPLAHCLVGINRQAITLDPPGSYRCTCPARVDMAEMLRSARETLETFQINERVDLVGHIIIFERSGHYPFLEEPQRFTQELQAFLQ